jgi:VWFA-related protein
MPRRLVWCVILAGFVSALHGQTTLSVVVTDSKGNRISSLHREDFQIAKNEITSFTDANATRAIPRRIIVLFDVTSITLPARAAIVRALHDFLATSLRPGDRVLILTAGQSLTPLSGWTSEKKDIDAALDRASTAASQTMAGDRMQAERRLRELINDVQQASGSQSSFYSFDTLTTAVRNYAAAVYRDTRQSIGLMATATDLFPSRATRNVLIIAGAGIPVRPGADMFQYLDTVKAQAEQGMLGSTLRQGAARSSPLSESSSFDLATVLRDFSTEAWSKGVAIYTIDSEIGDSASTTVESQRITDRAAAFTATANMSGGYQMIADGTGGLAIFAKEPGQALEQIRSDLDAFYTIGIHAPATRDAVQIQSKGYKVRVTPGGLQPTPDVEISSHVVAHHLLKPDTNDLGITLQAAEAVTEGSEVTGGFSVYIATGDQLGHASHVSKQTKQLRWPAAALQAAGERQLTFAVEVVLEPGRNQISVGVLDDQSKTTGYDRVSI